MNIQPGMFVKIDGCTIYFEVETVFNTAVVCADRDPKKGTDLVFRSNIIDCVQTPPHNTWIKLNREKGYYDKFHPEGWQPSKTKVIPFSDIEEGMTLIGYKGLFIPVRKTGNTWYCTGAQKTLSSKNNDTYIMHLIQREGKI